MVLVKDGSQEHYLWACIACLYVMLLAWVLSQISRIIYFQHRLMSLQGGFLMLCLTWTMLRVVFWLMDTVRWPKGLALAVYWAPTLIQFAMFSLLAFFYAKLVHFRRWKRVKRWCYCLYITLNLLFTCFTVVWIVLEELTYSEDEVDFVFSLFSALVFGVLLVILCWYGYKVYKMQLQNRMRMLHPFASSTAMVGLTLLSGLVFFTRCLYGLLQCIGGWEVMPIPVGSRHIAGSAISLSARGPGGGWKVIDYPTFVLNITWEIMPTVAVLYFFKAIPRSRDTLYKSVREVVCGHRKPRLGLLAGISAPPTPMSQHWETVEHYKVPPQAADSLNRSPSLDAIAPPALSSSAAGNASGDAAAAGGDESGAAMMAAMEAGGVGPPRPSAGADNAVPGRSAPRSVAGNGGTAAQATAHSVASSAASSVRPPLHQQSSSLVQPLVVVHNAQTRTESTQSVATDASIESISKMAMMPPSHDRSASEAGGGGRSSGGSSAMLQGRSISGADMARNGSRGRRKLRAKDSDSETSPFVSSIKSAEPGFAFTPGIGWNLPPPVVGGGGSIEPRDYLLMASSPSAKPTIFPRIPKSKRRAQTSGGHGSSSSALHSIHGSMQSSVSDSSWGRGYR